MSVINKKTCSYAKSLQNTFERELKLRLQSDVCYQEF